MARHALLDRLGLEHPILLAPMAGSGGTPELAAAVSNAGGLGAWGGAYSKPDDIAAAIRRIRQITSGHSASICLPGAMPANRSSTLSRCSKS